MNEFSHHRRYETDGSLAVSGPLSSVAAWKAAKADPAYRDEAARQAKSAAQADVEDRVMEWVGAVAAEAWDDL